jgi:hypothetical protein
VVKNNIDCQVFQDQLDSLKQGVLSDDGIAQLQLHAASCPECETLLGLHEHLSLASLEDLEAAVPDLFVASMWDRVQADIATQTAPDRRFGNWHRSRWLVPALAAASLLLLVSTALLLGELGRLRGREQVLVQRVTEHEQRLADLELTTASGNATRAANLASRRVLERVLSRRESVSIGELGEILERLPAGTTVVSTSGMEALVGNLSFRASPAWRAVRKEIDVEGGVDAGELLHVLEALDVDPATRIPSARLLAVARGQAYSGRS